MPRVMLSAFPLRPFGTVAMQGASDLKRYAKAASAGFRSHKKHINSASFRVQLSRLALDFYILSGKSCSAFQCQELRL